MNLKEVSVRGRQRRRQQDPSRAGKEAEHSQRTARRHALTEAGPRWQQTGGGVAVNAGAGGSVCT